MKNIFKILVFIFYFLFFNYYCFSQRNSADTVLANGYLDKAMSFEKSRLNDSAIGYYILAAQAAEPLFNTETPQALTEKYLSILNKLSRIYSIAGKIKLAIILSDSTINLSHRTLGDSTRFIANACNNKGIIYYRMSNYDMALDNFLTMLNISIKLNGNQHINVAKSYTNIGNIYYAKSDYNLALFYYLKSLELKTKLLGENHGEVAELYNNIGVIYTFKTEYDKALEYFFKSLELKKKLLGEKHADIALTYNNIGSICKEKNEINQALEYYFKSVEIRKETSGENSDDMCSCYLNIAVAYQDIYQYDTALIYGFKALEITNKLHEGNHNNSILIYNLLGSVYKDINEFDNALNYLHKGLVISKQIYGEKHPLVATSYNEVGSTYLKKKQILTALQYYHLGLSSCLPDFTADTTSTSMETEHGILAVSAMRNYLNHTPLLQNLRGKARCLVELSQNSNIIHNLAGERGLVLALQHYQAADTLISLVRKNINLENDKLKYSEICSDIFRNAVDVCIKLSEITEKADYYKQLAFYFSELNKSQVLIENISRQSNMRFAGISDSLLQKESYLKFAIAQITNKLESTNKTDSIQISAFRSNLFRYNRSYDSLIEIFKKNYPDYYSLKFKPIQKSVKDLQTSILHDKSSAMISFSIGKSKITIFTLTNKIFDIQQVVKPKNFEETIQLYRNSLRKANDKAFVRQYKRLAYQLYEMLFPQILRDKKFNNIESLLIVPDGVLGIIPFETLLTDSFGRNDFVLPYLIRRYNVSYAYSTNLLTKTNDVETSNMNDWLAIAPIFDDNQTNLLSLRTRDILQNITVSSDSITRAFYNGNQINSLPGTEMEVKNICKQFETNNRIALVLMHKRANKGFIMSDSIQQFRIIHFATHGFVNSEKPNLSGILLAQSDSSNTNIPIFQKIELLNNGFLYANEIYNMKLKADLVVLSACETGLGKILKGEGVIGLTRALLYAGTKNIVVSLWKVSDISTAILMENFYKYLLQKNSKYQKNKTFGEALRNAKLQMIENGGVTAHPYYWSPFILIGR